ncbi:MAG: hypothetical protein LBL52_02750, partial [Rickettsiales bacterium]|nr:hypothetical protein [Rickettsiales bacterium]
MKKILASLFACALVGVAAIRYADAAPNERERKGAGSKQPARASGTSKPSTGAKQPARAASGA